MSKLDLSIAQQSFQTLLQQIESPETIRKFLDWIQTNWFSECESDYVSMIDEQLMKLASEFREKLPMNAILPTEHINFPTEGENACDPKTTVHVDAFLYDDNLIDELCEEGKMSRNYCKKCGSHDVEPLTFISHSASRERLRFIFQALLPPLKNHIIVDIGSRLGACLYGAYFYTESKRIIGVEMNEEFCSLQTETIRRWNFQDRIEIVQGDICNLPKLVQMADVIILNNVFEFFMPQDFQEKAWQFLKLNIKQGALIVTVPSLHESLHNLQMGIDVEQWVRELPVHNSQLSSVADFETELCEVKLYEVL